MTDDWHDLLAFVIASAIGCLDEPPLYGPLRLIETMEKLIGFADTHGLAQDERLLALQAKIEAGKNTCMYSEADFRRLLQEVGLGMTDVIMG